MSEQHESGPATSDGIDEQDSLTQDNVVSDEHDAASVEGDDAEGESGDVGAEADDDEVVAEAAAQDSPPSDEDEQELSWEDRVERLKEQAAERDGEEAARAIIAAVRLVDLKEPGDFAIAEIWGDALQQIPEQARLLWRELSRVVSIASDVWEQVSIAHQVAHGGLDGEAADAVGEAWGWVQVLRSGERTAGLERLEPYAESTPSGFSAQLLESVEAAESGNWRKVETLVGEQLGTAGVAGDALTVETALRVSDLAVAYEAADRAVEVLRRVFRTNADNAELRSTLGVLYRDTEKWNAYVDVLKKSGEDSTDVTEQVDIYLEMVRVYGDCMNLDAQVVKAYGMILEVDPTNAGATAALAEAYERSRRWPDLVSLLQTQVEGVKSKGKRRDLNFRIATIYLDNLSRQVDAITYFEKVLEDSPGHREALEQLKSLYERRREWEKLIEVHQLEIAGLEDPLEQVERLKEVAEIATGKLRKAPVAIEIWQSVLAIDSAHEEALNTLESLYEREKDWASLARTCERIAELEQDTEKQLELWQKLGSLCGDRIGDSDGAIRAWRRVLTLEPGHSRAVDSLRKLLIDTRAWGELQALLAENGSWEDVVRTLEALASTTKEPSDAIALLLSAATLWSEQLDNAERSQRALEKVFEHDASNARAANLLTPYYTSQKNHAQLARMIQIRLEAEEDLGARVQLALQLAALNEGPLSDLKEAFDWLLLVVEEKPNHIDAYDALERVGEQLDREAEVVDAYQAVLEKLETADERQEVLCRKGRLMAVALGQIDEAKAIFEEILDREPENLRALGGLERIFERTGRFDELIEVNERRLSLATEPKDEAEILLSGARIHEHQRGDIARAVESYERVRELTPADDRPLVELQRLYRGEGEFEALANVLRAHLTLLVPERAPVEPEEVIRRTAAELDEDGEPIVPDGAVLEHDEDGLPIVVTTEYIEPEQEDETDNDVAIPLWFELGTIARKELYETDEAVDCFAKVVKADIEHEEAREALESMLEEAIERARIAVILEPVYTYLADYEALVGTLNVQLEETSDAARQVELLQRIGRTQREELGDNSEAFKALARALTLAPADQEVDETLRAIAEQEERWPDLADEYGRVAQTVEDRALRTSYDLRLAGLYETQLEQIERAVAYGRAALERSKDDGAVLERLEALFMAAEAWEALLAVLEAKVGLCLDELEAKQDLRLRMASVLEELLERKEEAVELYNTVLEDEASNRNALDALDRLYAELQRWDELAANFQRRIDLLETDAERDPVRCRLAAVLDAHLGEAERAIEIYREVLERDAGDETALRSLEGMLENADALFVDTIAEVLLPLYDAADDWEKRVWADEMLLRVIDDPERRLELFKEIAQLKESRGQLFDEVFETYARAFKEAPADEDIITHIYRYAEALETWAELVVVMTEVAEGAEDPILAKDTQVRVANVYRDQLQDIEGATAAYERANEFDPEDGAILDALEGIYREGNAWQPLTAVLAKKAAVAEDIEDKKQLLFQSALICEEMLDEPERATEMFREVLTLDPLDPTAVDSLERLYLSMEQWDELMAIYAIKVERANSEEAQKELHFVVGALQERELSDYYGAVETYRRVLDLDPDDSQALEALDRLYVHLEDWVNLLEILEREEESCDDPEAKLALRFRQGEVWRNQQNDPLRAIEVYRSVLESDGGYDAAHAALEELIEAEEYAVPAAEVLEPVYKGIGDWERLIAVYEVLIRYSDDIERRIELLSTIGMLREDMQADGPAAFDVWFRAIEADPSRASSWEVIERIAGSTGMWDVLVERGRALLESLEEAGAAIVVASHLATAYEDQLDAAADAIAMWNHVLELDPIEHNAVLALDRLYERQGMWDELAAILGREIELAGAHEEILRLRFRLGTINENFLNDVGAAIESYNEMLLLEPGHSEAVDSLERMFEAGMGQVEVGAILEPFYRETERWDKFVELALALLDHFDDASERYAKLLDVAEVFLGPLENQANALYVYGRALVERPGDAFAIARLGELAEAIGVWDDAIDFMRAALDVTDDEDIQRDLYWRVAEAYDHKVGNPEQAELAYRHVLEIAPDTLEALQALDRIYSEQGRFDLLVSVLQREITCSPDDYERIGLYMRLGTVQEDMIADTDAAIACFREVLAIDPSQREALFALERNHISREEWEDLYQVYGQIGATAESDGERGETWAKMANLAAEVLNRRADAIDHWYQVIDLHGDADEPLQALETLFSMDARWPEMADVVERQIPLATSGEEQLELYRKLGRLWGGPLENDERALEYWRRAMEVHPQDLETLLAIKAIDETLGDFDDLVGIIRRLVALGTLDQPEQLAHFVQLGEILSQILIRPEEAIDTWIQVLQLEPFHMQALNALEQLYVDGGRWEEAVDVLDRKVEVVEPDEAIAIRMQIAEIWESQVQNVEMAVAAYDAVLDMEPAHNEAFSRLESLHTQHEHWQQLLGLYVVRAEVLEETAPKMDTLRKAAAIAEEKLDQPEMAFVVLQGALLTNWRDQWIADELERLADLTSNWRELVGIYENIITGVQDPKEALELHNNVARWYFHKLRDNERSWHHFQIVLGFNPNNLNALGALSEIYKRLGSWEELVNIQIRRVELTDDVELQAELYTNIATVWEEQLGNQDKAIAAYKDVLKFDDANLNALKQLERIYQMSQKWKELVGVLGTQAQIIYEPEEVVRLRFRIGELWETCIEDDEQSIAAYRSVLSVEETHRDALEALERLYTRLLRWRDLLGVYEQQLSAAETGAQQIELYTKMATVYEEEFRDANNAITCMRHITAIDPSNLMAIHTLERLYRENERWPDLVDALMAHSDIVSDLNERIELQRQLGGVFRDHLQDYYRAIESYRNLLDLRPVDTRALAALADLYYGSADWAACIETIDRHIGSVADPEEGVALQHRVGQIYENHLGEYDRAEDRYQIALDINPAYMPAIDALQTLYERREDFSGVIRMLKQKVEHTLDLSEKADLLCLIGQIYDLHMTDSINAIDYYEQTLGLSPTNVYAARPLAEKYVREQRWARAETLLEMMVQQLGFSRELEDLYLLHYWLGLCAQHLGQDEKSLRHYRESYELKQSHLPTLLGMGRMLYRCQDHDRAYKMFQTVLVQYANELSGDQLAQVYYDSAEIKRALGDPVQAQHLLEKVLELDPTNRETIDTMIELNEEQENWEMVVQYKEHRLNVGLPNDERFSEYVEIAGIWRQQLSNSERATESYLKALEIDPDSKLVTLKLLDIYTQGRHWDEALASLARLCEMEQSPDRLAKFYYTMAVISRDELNNEASAVEFFNKTLDHNVNELRAFEAIDRILTAEKDWRELERNYRKMIKRVYDLDEGQFEDTKFLLWYGLAEIYRTRLTEWESAISAFKQAATLRPKESKMHRILADLYVRVGGQDDSAIKEFQTLINMPPDPTDPYAHSSNPHERNAEFFHSLFKLYLKTKRYDQAWCITNVMNYLRIATDEEKQFNERYLGPSLVQAQGRLTPESWKMVYHPEENLRIGNVLNVLGAYSRDIFAYDLKKTWGLRKKDELDQNADFLFCKMYRYLAQVIGVVPAPKLFLNREQPLGMIAGNLDPPGFIVGADMMQGRGQRELAFIIARQLALAIPIHYLGSLRLPTENLKFLMLGAIQSMSATPKAADPNLEVVVKAIHKMPPPVRIDLGKILKPIVDGRVEVNMSAWLKAIDHTANRVGLVLCGDTEVAMSAIKNERTPISKLTVAEKEAELLKYAISDDFFAARERLGLAIT